MLLGIALSLVSVSAFAEKAGLDPRTSTELVLMLQAAIAFKDAVIKATQEDLAKREQDWAEYSKPLWSSEPPKP